MALKQEAKGLGFQLAGACPAVTPQGIHRFYEWLDHGYAGQMHYLVDRAEAYQQPQNVLTGARSILMLGMNYRTGVPQAANPSEGRISCYAWGDVDYHDLIHDRLRRLAGFLRQLQPGCQARGVVDTAPLLEREFAQLAGLGWVGKNTLLLNQRMGSWFFLAALLTDAILDYDAPHETDHCGTCRACLDACPTGAFPQPYVLDATRCLSYLTIELRDVIPNEHRHSFGDWLFGCDVCQVVCPWNHRAPESSESGFAPREDQNPVELSGLFFLSDDDFRRRFRKTPLWRAKRRGILRNAAIVLGSRRQAAPVTALAHGLNDGEPLVRASCAWALGEIKVAASIKALTARSSKETDVAVQEETRLALRRLSNE